MPTTLIEKIRNRKHCYECAYYNKIAAKCSRFNKPLSLWQIIGRVKCRSFVTPNFDCLTANDDVVDFSDNVFGLPYTNNWYYIEENKKGE